MGIKDLQERIEQHNNWLVITGAGISAESGIPTYRNDNGDWIRSEPITHQQFIEKESMRKRYWARSAIGWPMVAEAQPTSTHFALVALEKKGILSGLITQNVDGLHQKAGHTEVIDLHGRVDKVKCLSCQMKVARAELQEKLIEKNPFLAKITGEIAPDGDASIEDHITEKIILVSCSECDGTLMPDVVFYGGSVPAITNQRTETLYSQSKGVFVLGSSLMVYSSFRFCKKASADGKSIIIINKGKTRADEIADLKIEADCRIVSQLDL